MRYLPHSDADRELIAQAILTGPGERILITHGTDTMVETARYLAGNPALTDRTIVLTGALAPAMFRNTDAPVNIGCAGAAVQCLRPGVYVAMNGRVFRHDDVRKNLDKGMFESLA